MREGGEGGGKRERKGGRKREREGVELKLACNCIHTHTVWRGVGILSASIIMYGSIGTINCTARQGECGSM